MGLSLLRPQMNFESGMENFLQADIETSAGAPYESGATVGGTILFVRRPGAFIASGGYGNTGWNGADISGFGMCSSAGNANCWRRYKNSDFTATCTPDCGIYPPSGSGEIQLTLYVDPFLALSGSPPGWHYTVGTTGTPAVVAGTGTNPFIIGDIYDGGTHLKITGEVLSHTAASATGDDVTLTVTESWSIRFHYTDYSLGNGWPTDPEIRTAVDFTYALSLGLTNGLKPTGRIADLWSLFSAAISGGYATPSDMFTYDNSGTLTHQPALVALGITPPPSPDDPFNGWGFMSYLNAESGFADYYMLCLNGWHIQGDAADWSVDFATDGTYGAFTKRADLLGREWHELLTPDEDIVSDYNGLADQKLFRWHMLGTPSTHPNLQNGLYAVPLIGANGPWAPGDYPTNFSSPPTGVPPINWPPANPALSSPTTAITANPGGCGAAPGYGAGNGTY